MYNDKLYDKKTDIILNMHYTYKEYVERGVGNVNSPSSSDDISNGTPNEKEFMLY